MNSISTPPWASESIERRNIEDPTKPVTWDQLREALSFGDVSEVGRDISPATAMQIGTVLACVRIISQTIAKMPCITYRKTDTGRERNPQHPIYRLVRMRPDATTSAFHLFQSMVANMLLWGNGYAEIVRRGDGTPVGLTPVEASRVRPRLAGASLVYDISGAASGPVTLTGYEMLHVPGLSRNGIVGESVISVSRRTLGIAKSGGDAAGHLQKNGLRPGGVLETPTKINEPGPENLRKEFARLHGGPENTGKVIVLEQGVTFKPWTMPAQDAELLASRQFSRKEIAELFGVPLSLLGDNESAGSNVEATSLNFLNFTLDPIIEAIQQELNYKFFDEDEWDSQYCEFLTQSVLKMDANARVNLYRGLHGVGAMSADEIRARENLNAIPDGRGKVHYVPSSMMPAPTPEKADELLDGWIKKNTGGDSKGEPKPDTDGKVAG